MIVAATTTSAPAKVILFGEHAAVYGQPAIAVPVSTLRATATVTPLPPESGLHITAVDVGMTLPIDLDRDDLDHALAVAARLTLRRLHVSTLNAAVTLHSQIPIASGLGSGAAVSTALVRALAVAVGQPLDTAEVSAIVYEVEKIFHGTPSGIDNTVIAYEQPIWFVRDQPIERLVIGTPILLLIADTGVQASTKSAVGAVRALFERDPVGIQSVLDAIGAISRSARAALESGQPAALGPLLIDNHRLLQRLTVSSPELDRLVTAALDTGAIGAKLSGGGRGGNLIALVTPDTHHIVSAALIAAGAVRVFSTTLT